jgi:heme/copper-type cytochrome/quinol oxidase subunit 1
VERGLDGGAFIFGISQLLFFYNVIATIRAARRREQKQWEGADSLEWTHLPTPVPYHTFETAPVNQVRMSRAQTDDDQRKQALITGVVLAALALGVYVVVILKYVTTDVNAELQRETGS